MKPTLRENSEARRYLVSHITTYSYTGDVTASYGRACLCPRESAEQAVITNEIEVDPTPDSFTEHVDMFGNLSHYLELHTPHRHLVVAKKSTVDVERRPVDLAEFDEWTVASASLALAGRAATGGEDLTLRAGYLLPSPLVDIAPEVRAYAERFLPARAPLGTALAALISGIYEDFTYSKGATTVRTTLPELLDLRAGVCQDFAHLAAGCLRSVGLPARYVSGYLETQPPPGKPKLRGADATHAWVSVQVPGGGWLDLDPTNDCAADSRYIVTAWGRDYRDVAPLRGVIYTEGATSSLDVSVDVDRLPRRSR